MQWRLLNPNPRSKWPQSALVALGSFSLLCIPLSSSAVQLANGTVHFDSVPIFKEASTTISHADASGATYYFHLTIPPNAGEPLKHVVIGQTEGIDSIEFNLKRTKAALNNRKGPVIPIEAVHYKDSGAVQVTFAEPVQPGNDIVIGLKPYYNPDDGIYLFGITAIPDGDLAQPQFIGHGRLHFYNHSFFGSFRGW